ncbi:MAG: ABC transporter substrate-binding protein [Trueperaceae bacterium]|nr:ABC transporter substrate-binding protein [Trueperaceae bacterium]
MKHTFRSLLMILAIAVFGSALAQSGSLTIESWRNDDLAIWNELIIPAFNEQYPDIEVRFTPTAPTEYNAVLNSKLEAGSAGDLITCRPFDQSLELFNRGFLASLSDLPGMENFSDVARSAWVTDDGSDVFCVPMASVIHGFIYNRDIFEELGIFDEPETYAEFLSLLETISEDGRYAPLVMGTADQWESATMGYQNIGPNFWNGEQGRLELIAGTTGYDEDGFLEAFRALAEWQPYLARGYQALSYPDAQNFFAFGQGAIYPAGSWDISVFNPLVDFEMGAFKPPVPEGQDTCYISDHTDIAMGLNADSPNQEAARTLLTWMTTPEFAEIYANALPGFFSLSTHDVTLQDPLAQTFVSWRAECESTIRSSYQILSRGEPNNELDLWNASAQVLNGTATPEEAATSVQNGLENWYGPQQE